jgi:hypothetical protein
MWAFRDVARRWTTAGVTAVVFCLLASTAGAAGTPPTAITGPVTATAATTATITGTVNPNGTSTNWYFDYGTTTGYGSSTPQANAGAGTANTGVSSNLSGLTGGTTYHYRLVATSTAGVTNGADGIFTTSSAPAVVTSAATGVSTTGATLNGTVNPNGQATTYQFEYGKDTKYGSKTTPVSVGSGTAPASVSSPISGLQAGQTYHFRLDATSDAGTTFGADMSFTATGSGPAATTKAATNLTPTGAKLNGTVNPNGLATTYYFDYGTSTSYGSRTAVGNAGSGKGNVNVSATISGIGAGVYHFRLVATSSAGTTFGNDLSFGSAGPPVVLTGSAQGASTSGVTLTGSVNPSGNATNWWFEYGPTSAYGTKTAAKSAGSGTAATGVSAAIMKLTAGTTYHYRLVASSSAGTTYGGDVTFSTIAAVSLQASTVQVVYGSAATLSGAIATRQSGVTVSILATPYGSSSASTLATVSTGPGGLWTYQAKPKLQTAYQAKAPDGTSPLVTIGVRPAVSLRVITGGRFASRATASKSFAGKSVQLQRLLPGNRWATVAKAKLNAKSSATFHATALPKGPSLIRVAMSVNQAGAGYLGGFSRTLSYRR